MREGNREIGEGVREEIGGRRGGEVREKVEGRRCGVIRRRVRESGRERLRWRSSGEGVGGGRCLAGAESSEWVAHGGWDCSGTRGDVPIDDHWRGLRGWCEVFLDLFFLLDLARQVVSHSLGLVGLSDGRRLGEEVFE